MSYLPQVSIAALERLGFATGAEEKNYSYERDLSGAPGFDAIATLMLSALHDAYGVRADMSLETRAPFAGTLVVACLR